MPCGPLSAISGILAGRILGFGTADRVVLHLHCDLAVMSGWSVLLFARSYLNSSAHKLPASQCGIKIYALRNSFISRKTV